MKYLLGILLVLACGAAISSNALMEADVKVKALQDFVWVKIKASEMEQNRHFKVFAVSKAARSVLDPLNDGVDALADCVCDPVLQIGEDIVESLLEHPGDPLDRIDLRSDRPGVPLLEEVLRSSLVDVSPEILEGLLDGPGPCGLEIAVSQLLEGLPGAGSELRRAFQPTVPRAFEETLAVRL